MNGIETSFEVQGMSCDHCVQTVTRALMSLAGVTSALVDLEQSQAQVTYDGTRVATQDMFRAVQEAGFLVPSSKELSVVTEEQPGSLPRARDERIVLDVRGMHCASCTSRVEQALLQLEAVTQARANLVTEQVTVDYATGVCSPRELEKCLDRAGYPATREVPELSTESLFARMSDAAHAWQRQVQWGSLLVLPLVLNHALLFWYPWSGQGWVQWLLATMVQVYLGKRFYVGAWRRACQGTTNMDTLIALGCTAAYGRGVYHFFWKNEAMMFLEAGMILGIVTLGKFLEARSKGHASQAIGRLVELAPRRVVVQRDELVEVSVHEVSPGETMLVRPGGRIGLDGQIVTGRSAVDESWVTGESMPVEKGVGDVILAGAINGTGSLTARVTHAAQETSLSRVIEIVRRVQESRAHVQRLADRVVQVFVPVVMGIALVTLVTWCLSGDVLQGVRCMTAVLVVACPCALGLATPTAILVASAYGARKGILIKEAQALETAGRLDTLVFDKTGTLTLGEPQVNEVIVVEGVERAEFLQGLAAAEVASSHPFASSIVAVAGCSSATLAVATELETFPGEGILAQVAGKSWAVGNLDYLDRLGISISESMREEIARQRSQARTALLVAVDGVFQGVVAVSDPVKATAKQAVAKLRSWGVDLCMLTGDHHAVATSVAQQLGIKRVQAQMKPADKQAEIEAMQSSGHVVGMVGDGVNDAPALATADLGIALGTGTDVAVESADVVLMGGDLSLVAETVGLARATMRTIYQNLGWALVYNAILLPAAAGLLVLVGRGQPLFVPPMLAAAAMGLSSVSVVGNSLLLKKRVIG